MLNICFTADHELYFGRNYVSEEEVLICPTYRLMEVLEENNIPLCLMTDVCSIQRYRELKINSPYVAMMEEQLRNAIERGHDVQLHIHPHWLTSEYVDDQWNFNYSNFKLHSFGFGTDSNQNGSRIIAEGKQYLVNLLKPVDANYKCVAFRAGGWCIQPEKEFLKALASEGIVIDTTVFHGGYIKDKFNFRHVPNKPNWWINPKNGLGYEAEKAEGNLFEVAIGSYSIKTMIGLKKTILRFYRMRLYRKVTKVRGITIDRMSRKSRLVELVDIFKNFLLQPIMFSFDSACKEAMLELMTFYLKRFDCKKQEIYISIIGHPKGLNEEALDEIRKFCETVSNEYSHVVRFIRLRDILL